MVRGAGVGAPRGRMTCWTLTEQRGSGRGDRHYHSAARGPLNARCAGYHYHTARPAGPVPCCQLPYALARLW